ncbi:MAG: helix-turn-helix domain-containing protein [Candidatus Competibacteraceae bacterium]
MANRRTIFLSPEQEAKLTAVYTRKCLGTVQALSVEWGINDSTLSYYAKHHLGMTPMVPYRQRREWTPIELEILERYSHASDRVMAGHLRRLAGSRRSLMAIGVKRSRIGMLQESIEDMGFLSTELVAAGLGMHVKSVSRWIENGYLKATRRRGHWWGVSYEDLRAFLLHPTNAQRWSVKKVNQTFFLDVLRGPTTIPKDLAPAPRIGGGIRTHTVHQPEAAYV